MNPVHVILIVISFAAGSWFSSWVNRSSKLRRENRILRQRAARLEKSLSESDDNLSGMIEVHKLYRDEIKKQFPGWAQ
jgi:hypothetical protein